MGKMFSCCISKKGRQGTSELEQLEPHNPPLRKTAQEGVKFPLLRSIDDGLDSFATHGVGGTVGCILTGAFNVQGPNYGAQAPARRARCR